MKKLLLALIVSTATFAAVRNSEAVKMAPGKINRGEKMQITPEAGPRVTHGIDAFITADFIYWTPRMDGLGYMITGVSGGSNNTGKGSVKYPDWEWDPGFKVGLGLNLPHDGWDIFAEYTWLHSTASDSHKPTGNGMLPPWNIANLLNILQNDESIDDSKAHFKIHFSTIDLSLGRNYFISRFLTLRPFIGFKASWIDIDYDVHYLLGSGSVDSNVKMRNDQDFWGIGLRSGLDTSWHLAPSWSIYGDLALAALWSQFEVTRKDTRNDSNNPGGPNDPPLNTTMTQLHSEDEFHTIKGVLEFGIGLRGEWWFFEDRFHFLVQAGWEEQLWLNMNNLLKRHFVQSAHGDLILQGLTIKTRFDF